MHIKNIQWPVYGFRAFDSIKEEDNILHIYTATGKFIVDNKNLNSPSLGLRRLRIPGEKLYKLSKTYFSIAQLLKSTSYNNTFIDSAGILFTLKKTRRTPLVYKRIVSNRKVEGEGILVYVKDIGYPFMIHPKAIKEYCKYLGLLYINGGYIVYESCKEKKKDTWRKI